MASLQDILKIPTTTGKRGIEQAQAIVQEYLDGQTPVPKPTKVKTEPGKIKKIEK